ncbi:MAG: FGGY-family carbohydrate kinase [Gammaproteobacteria bacterium]
MPRIQPIRCDYGKLSGTAIPLSAVNGDQTAALFAQGAIRPSDLHVNLGTGGFVLKPTGGSPVRHAALLAGPCDSSDGERSFLIEGTVNGAGAALRWAHKSLGFETSPQAVAHCLASCPAPQALFINSIGGLGSPWWRDGPDPHWCDLEGARVETPGETVAVAAIMESVLFLVTRNIRTMFDAGLSADGILISGGLSNHDSVCRKLAALAGLPVRRLHQPEATARGIAWLALGRPASWRSSEPQAFLPQTDNGLQQRYDRFVAVLERQG